MTLRRWSTKVYTNGDDDDVVVVVDDDHDDDHDDDDHHYGDDKGYEYILSTIEWAMTQLFEIHSISRNIVASSGFFLLFFCVCLFL